MSKVMMVTLGRKKLVISGNCSCFGRCCLSTSLICRERQLLPGKGTTFAYNFRMHNKTSFGVNGGNAPVQRTILTARISLT